MTAGRVDQPDLGNTLRNHEKRLAALEATPAAINSLYVDDRLLDADTDSVLLDAFPPDLAVLEISWRACHNNAGTGVGMLMFNQDHFPDDSADWLWNLDIANTISGQGQLTDSSYTNIAGGFAFIPDFASLNVPGAGAIRLPNYANTVMGDAESYVGYGQASLATPTPDDFTIGGYRQNTDAITSVLLGVFALADPTLATPFQWKAGTRFTLVGYPA